MWRDDIYQAYEDMKPDEAARRRMLKKIRSAAGREEFLKKEKRKNMGKESVKFSFRLAAGAAVGCIIIGSAAYAAYHFGLKDMGMEKEKVLDLTVPAEKLQGEDIPMKEVDMISLAGAEGGPEHEAAAEWQAFLEDYDRDESILSAVGDNPTGFEEEYGEYTCYTQEMADKIDEICEKYGLRKLSGFQLPEDYEGLLNGVGISDFLGDASEGTKAEYVSGYYYADGSFDYDGSAVIGGSSPVMTDYQFSRAMKGTFKPFSLNVGDLDAYREWTYTTKGGVTVLLANSPDKALIFADREKSFVSINVLGSITADTFEVSDEMLEDLAEAFDFSAIP